MPIKTIVDIKDMPGYNPAVKNGIDSVSAGRVRLVGSPASAFYRWLYSEYRSGSRIPAEHRAPTPYCDRHGAMLKVSKDGIWRCGELGCDNGCYATH